METISLLALLSGGYYLSQNKQKYCLEISIEELRTKYGSDLKSDNTRKKFVNDKQNKNDR